MLKVIAACGNGMGSSQIIKMKIEKVFKNLGISVDITHSSVGEAKSVAASYDVVFCPENFKDAFDAAKQKGTKIITLKNLLSELEIEEKIKENLLDQK